MSKPLLIIADRDEDYLLAIEKKILKEIGNQIELEVISDVNYFTQFFSTPKTAELMVVGEDLFTRELLKHNIAHVFILSETIHNIDDGSTMELSAEYVNRYASTSEIFNQIVRFSRDKLLQDTIQKKETQVVAFYSACGGTGKTAISLGLAKSLADKYLRVLYVSTESVQSFGFYMTHHGDYLGEEGYRAIRSAGRAVYANLKEHLRCEGFDYIPPMMTSLDARNISTDIYRYFVQGAKESKDYDYIIVDIEAGYSNERLELLSLADKIYIIVLPTKISVTKMQFLEQNISMNDKEKYVCVCNRCRQNDENMNQYFTRMHTSIQEMIYECEAEPQSIEELKMLTGMQALVQSI